MLYFVMTKHGSIRKMRFQCRSACRFRKKHFLRKKQNVSLKACCLRAVARWMHADEHDYLTMLSGLGQECLGAIQVMEGNTKPPKARYTRMTEQQLQEFAAEGAIKSAELVTALHLSLMK